MPRAVLLVVAFAAAGCVGHTARIVRPADPAAKGMIGVGADQPLPERTIIHRAQPIDLPISAWYRDPAQGPLLRCETRARTPLPWWQRFPADLVTDLLLPWRFDVDVEVPIALHEVGETDRAALEAAARRAGYARTTPANP